MEDRPLNQWVAGPEYKKRTGESGFMARAYVKKNKHLFERLIDTFTVDDCEIIHGGFNMESGGKVPRAACVKCDAWLRKAAAVQPAALRALSEPTATEARKIAAGVT